MIYSSLGQLFFEIVWAYSVLYCICEIDSCLIFWFFDQNTHSWELDSCPIFWFFGHLCPSACWFVWCHLPVVLPLFFCHLHLFFTQSLSIFWRVYTFFFPKIILSFHLNSPSLSHSLRGRFYFLFLCVLKKF